MADRFYTSNLLSKHKSKMIKSNSALRIEKDENISDIDDHDIALEATILSLSETLQEYIDENTEEEQLQEGVREGIAKVAQVGRKVKDSVAKTVVKFTLADREMSERINEKFNRYIKIIRDGKRTASYDSIVKSAVNLSRILKNLLGSFIIGLLIPGGIPVKIVTASISLILKTVLDKRTDKKYKNLVFNDIKFEMSVVKEKIRDAESRGDIKAKYKLMRIENELGRAMNRIQFGIKE